MKTQKLMTPIAWGVGGIIGVFAMGSLFISCSPKAIPTAPPTPTNTPTVTRTPTSTGTVTYTPTLTPSSTPSATPTATYPPGTYTPTPLPTSTASSTPTSTVTATVTATPAGGLGPGSIAFTGITYNGDSQIAFVSTTPIPSGQVIYFTNYTWDATLGQLVDESYNCCSDTSNGLTVVEGIISYTATSGLSAYNQVVISNTGDASNVLQGGAVALVNGNVADPGDSWLLLNHNGNGDKILAFTTTASSPSTVTITSSNTTFLGAIIFGPDSWLSTEPVNVNLSTPSATGVPPFYDSNLPPGLVNGTTATDLSTLWNGAANLSQYADVDDQNDNAIVNSCNSSLSAFVSPADWDVDGNQSKSAVCLSVYAKSGATAVQTPCPSGSGGFSGNLP